MRRIPTTNKVAIILMLLMPFSYSHAKKFIPDFETTRLKSTAGAGVASVLIDEANYLNPASTAFFDIGSIYFQKAGLSSNTDTTASQPPSLEGSQISIIASDAKSSSAGSVSYNKMKYANEEVKSLGVSLSSPVGKKSALGASFNHLTQKLLDKNNNLVDSDYKVTTFGIIHNINESFMIGMVLKDAFRTKRNNTRGIVGVQYFYEDYISLMFDVGADYKNDLSSTTQWNAAAQLKLLDDFFIRFGFFDNKGLKTKGNGAGIGWLQPRLSIELALKNTNVLESIPLGQDSESLKETTFSLSYRF